MIPFEPFPKMARLSREIVITEKIDGTNAQVVVDYASDAQKAGHLEPPFIVVVGDKVLSAGSRTRWIVPGDDNFGFAAWVQKNAEELATLPVGRHFGEWWGSGIQRGYGLTNGEKRFSLFNVGRFRTAGATYEGDDRIVLPPSVGVVPTLYRGNFDTAIVEEVITLLRHGGSAAAPGFKKPEGIIVFHTAAGIGFKKTLEKDESPKSLVS